MKIAVTYKNGEVLQHFGQTLQFKIYNIENRKIISSDIVSINVSGHGALAGFLHDHGVNALICGDIGGGARLALSEFRIDLYTGAEGDTDNAVNALITGSLSYNPDTTCNHHHGGEEAHTKGVNGCGN